MENTENTEGQVTEPREYSAIEQKAIDQGWRPKEEFEGDPEAFIDAPEFVRRGELFQKIEHQSKEVKQLRAAIDALKEHNSKIREAEYNRALKALDAQRKAALAEGETDKFFALEEEIDNVKAERAELNKEPVKTEAPQVDPAFASWVAQNQWYESSKAMRAFADRIGIEFAQEGYPPATVLRMVEKEVKKEFAHKFQNSKASRPMNVEPAGRTGASGSSFQLTEDERTIMRKFVRSGVMTEKEYIDQLKSAKGG